VNEETKRELFLTDALWRSGPVELYFDRASNDRGQRIQPGKYRLKAYMYGTDDRVYPFALSDVFEVYALKGVPSLTWALYTSADPNDPVTSIDVRLRRADGSSVSTIVASVNAYCNEEDPTADLALDSTQLLCYYAGLGHEFRIIDRNGSYVVQKREFEEASPDYNPPVTGFEDVVTIE
jgi:hypothetical protein